jgi:hypothetical protein
MVKVGLTPSGFVEARRRRFEQGLKSALYQRRSVYVLLKEIVNSTKRGLHGSRLFSLFLVSLGWKSTSPCRDKGVQPWSNKHSTYAQHIREQRVSSSCRCRIPYILPTVSIRLEQAIQTAAARQTGTQTGKETASSTALLLLLWVHALTLWWRSLLVVHALLLIWLAVLALRWTILALRRSVALALLLVWVGRAVLVRRRLLVVALGCHLAALHRGVPAMCRLGI